MLLLNNLVSFAVYANRHFFCSHTTMNRLLVPLLLMLLLSLVAFVERYSFGGIEFVVVVVGGGGGGLVVFVFVRDADGAGDDTAAAAVG